MGNEKSKEANNEELKKIGEKANDNENKQTFDLNIKLTNEIIIDELKTNPEWDIYQKQIKMNYQYYKKWIIQIY